MDFAEKIIFGLWRFYGCRTADFIRDFAIGEHKSGLLLKFDEKLFVVVLVTLLYFGWWSCSKCRKCDGCVKKIKLYGVILKKIICQASRE